MMQGRPQTASGVATGSSRLWQDVGERLRGNIIVGGNNDVVAVEVAQISRLLGIRPGASVLQIPADAKPYCIELSRQGFVVTGVCRQEAVRRRLRRIAEAEELVVELVVEGVGEFVRPSGFD